MLSQIVMLAHAFGRDAAIVACACVMVIAIYFEDIYCWIESEDDCKVYDDGWTPPRQDQ